MKTELRHIDNGFYQISDKLAGKLARENPSTRDGPKKLPAHGYERKVFHAGRWYWLARTPYRYRLDAPKRGWVWSLHSAEPITLASFHA